MPLTAADIARLYDSEERALLAFFVRRTYAPDVAVDLVAETFAAAFEGCVPSTRPPRC